MHSLYWNNHLIGCLLLFIGLLGETVPSITTASLALALALVCIGGITLAERSEAKVIPPMQTKAKAKAKCAVVRDVGIWLLQIPATQILKAEQILEDEIKKY